jgi:hypothetical protein
MRFFQKLLITMVLFITAQAQAFTPESGFWWNPDESGSGYAIEIQDNFLFMTLYVYDEAGNPIWYSAGTHLEGNAFFDSVLNYSFDGACIDCGYTQPITIVGERGPITINFITETTATIQFQGAVKSIERFNFILGNELEKMMGEWQVIVDQSNLSSGYPYFADALIFDDTGFDSELGFDIAVGCRSESTYFFHACTTNAYENSLAAYFEDGLLFVVVEHDEDYFLTYKLTTGLQQFDGEAYFYLRGTNVDLDAEGFVVRGFRTASKTFTESGVGPSKSLEQIDGVIEKSTPLVLSKLLDDSQENTSLKEQRKYTIIKQLETFLEMSRKLEK